MAGVSNNLQLLPLEILECIARCLEIEDVLALSATSKGLRNGLNNDYVWKRFCSFKEEEYESWGEPEIRPMYCKPEEESSLSSICKWRTFYIMESLLKRNWVEGLCKKEKIKIGPSKLTYDKVKCGFYGNDHIFFQSMNVSENAAVGELWNVQKTPYLEATCDFVNAIHIDTFELVKVFFRKSGKLIVALNGIVIVFDVHLSPSPIIKQTFLFDMSLNAQDIQQSQTDARLPCIVAKDYFIGVQRNVSGNNERYSLLIWNINTGEKVKQFEIPASHLPVLDVKLLCADDEESFIVQLNIRNDRHRFHSCGFVLNNLDFSDFKVQVNYCDFFVFARDRVVGFGPRRLTLYNFKTSERIAVRKTVQEILPKTITVAGGILLYGQFDNIIAALDLSTFKVLKSVKLSCTLYNLRTISERFIVVNTIDSFVIDLRNEMKKAFEPPVNGVVVAVNEYSTKMVIERGNKLFILNFW